MGSCCLISDSKNAFNDAETFFMRRQMLDAKKKTGQKKLFNSTSTEDAPSEFEEGISLRDEVSRFFGQES